MNQEVEDTSTWKDQIINEDPTTETVNKDEEEVPRDVRNQSDLRYSLKCQIVQAVENGINTEKRIKKVIDETAPLITDCIRDLETEGVLTKVRKVE